MVREIVKDQIFLAIKSENASIKDLPAALDLIDTMNAHRDDCIGMAANMIGFSKRNIAFRPEGQGPVMIMMNPVIVSKSKEYETEEGCLSLPGVRKTVRYEKIGVEYCDMQMKKHKGTYTGLTAQIIQHEIDMTNGILI